MSLMKRMMRGRLGHSMGGDDDRLRILEVFSGSNETALLIVTRIARAIQYEMDFVIPTWIE